jgi:hypothetical protein
MNATILCLVCIAKHYKGDHVKEDEIDGTCTTHGSDEKCMQKFGWKTWREETTWKT